MHNKVFALCERTWEKDLATRPSIVECKNHLQELLDAENAVSPPMRDVGLTCYRALEAQRGRSKAGERGGSVIRTKGTPAE
jgi:hypothetical protein